MKNLLTLERIATGLRIYGLLNFLIELARFTPSVINQIHYSSMNTPINITALFNILVSKLLVLFLYFALALALETIVEIGTITKSASRSSP